MLHKHNKWNANKTCYSGMNKRVTIKIWNLDALREFKGLDSIPDSSLSMALKTISKNSSVALKKTNSGMSLGLRIKRKRSAKHPRMNNRACFITLPKAPLMNYQTQHPNNLLSNQTIQKDLNWYQALMIRAMKKRTSKMNCVKVWTVFVSQK